MNDASTVPSWTNQPLTFDQIAAMTSEVSTKCIITSDCASSSSGCVISQMVAKYGLQVEYTREQFKKLAGHTADLYSPYLRDADGFTCAVSLKCRCVPCYFLHRYQTFLWHAGLRGLKCCIFNKC